MHFSDAHKVGDPLVFWLKVWSLLTANDNPIHLAQVDVAQILQKRLERDELDFRVCSQQISKSPEVFSLVDGYAEPYVFWVVVPDEVLCLFGQQNKRVPWSCSDYLEHFLVEWNSAKVEEVAHETNADSCGLAQSRRLPKAFGMQVRCEVVTELAFVFHTFCLPTSPAMFTDGAALAATAYGGIPCFLEIFDTASVQCFTSSNVVS